MSQMVMRSSRGGKKKKKKSEKKKKKSEKKKKKKTNLMEIKKGLVLPRRTKILKITSIGICGSTSKVQ